LLAGSSFFRPSLSSSLLAVAHRHRLALLACSGGPRPRLVASLDAVSPPESVTSLAWVVFAASSSSGGGQAAAGTAPRPPRLPAAAAAATAAPCPPSPSATLNARSTPRLEEGCLLVGTSSGHLQIHAERAAAGSGKAGGSAATTTPPRARLLHRQRVHGGPILRLRLRPAGAGLDGQALDDDITAISPDAVARLAAVEARAVGRAAASRGGGGGPTTAHDWRGGGRLGGGGSPLLGVQRWDLRSARGVGPRTDGLVLGPRLPRLRDALEGRGGGGGEGGGGEAPTSRLVILSAGTSPALAAHDAAEHAPRGTAALVADLAASVAAGLLGAARAAVAGRGGGLRAGIRSWVTGEAAAPSASPRPASAPGDGAASSAWDSASAASSRPSSGGASPAATPGRPGSAGGGGAPPPPPLQPEKADPPPPGEAAPVWRSFADGPRTVTALHPSPTGALAAACDALGRVLLVDGADGGRVARVWKGYRRAQLAWVVLGPPSAALAAAASPALASALAAAAAEDGVPVSSASLTALVAYAPRRGVVEGWCVRTGARLGVARVGPAARLVAPEPVLGLGGGGGEGGGAGPRDAWLVDGGSGVVTSVVGLMEGGWSE